MDATLFPIPEIIELSAMFVNVLPSADGAPRSTAPTAFAKEYWILKDWKSLSGVLGAESLFKYRRYLLMSKRLRKTATQSAGGSRGPSPVGILVTFVPPKVTARRGMSDKPPRGTAATPEPLHGNHAKRQAPSAQRQHQSHRTAAAAKRSSNA